MQSAWLAAAMAAMRLVKREFVRPAQHLALWPSLTPAQTFGCRQPQESWSVKPGCSVKAQAWLTWPALAEVSSKQTAQESMEDTTSGLLEASREQLEADLTGLLAQLDSRRTAASTGAYMGDHCWSEGLT